MYLIPANQYIFHFDLNIPVYEEEFEYIEEKNFFLNKEPINFPEIKRNVCWIDRLILIAENAQKFVNIYEEIKKYVKTDTIWFPEGNLQISFTNKNINFANPDTLLLKIIGMAAKVGAFNKQTI